MADILVSISCMTYNHEKYIADAIESFLMQKTNFDFEILIHDDASTDTTANIIKEYVGKYPNLIKPMLQNENQKSKGVKRIGYDFYYTMANGKYIALCEGDDYWTDPYKLQKQVDYMEAHPDCSMCFHAAEVVKADKQKIDVIKPYSKNCISPTEDIILGGGEFISTNSILYRKSIMNNAPDFYFNAPVGDYPLQILCSNKDYAYYIDEFMAATRVGVEGSWTNYMLSGVNIKEKAVKTREEIMHMLDDFNKYSNYKYNKQVRKYTHKLKFQIIVWRYFSQVCLKLKKCM